MRTILDEDGRDLRALSSKLGREVLRGRAQREKRLAEKSAVIAGRHGFKNTAAHKQFLRQLSGLPTIILSAPSLGPLNWSVPRDLNSWKRAQMKIKTFATQLAAADETFTKILDDPVALAALDRSDVNGRLPELVEAFGAVMEVAGAAAKIKGAKGNRPHAPWKKDAVRLSRAFWREQKRETAKGYFNKIAKPRKGERSGNRITEPANAFSRWFCDVMQTVAGLTPSECDTLLRH